MLASAFYFILALFILVIVHEYGHFQVARWCGVKVLRFSFGFGQILGFWRDKKGTEYAWSLFPLGGYVKMLDETEGSVPEAEKHLAFNRKPTWIKIAIVAAGPLFNFVLAFILLWFTAIIGTQSLAPIIAEVKPNSLAAQANLHSQEEIIALNNTTIDSWRDFQYAMLPFIGSGETIQLTVKSLVDNSKKNVNLSLDTWKIDAKKPDMLASLGIIPFIPSIPAEIGEVVNDLPAAKAGLLANDKLLTIDNKPITDWLDVVDYVKKHPKTAIVLRIERHAQQQTIMLTPDEKIVNGKPEGFIGLSPKPVKWPAHWLRLQQDNWLDAISASAKLTMQLTSNTFTLLGRMVTGKLSLDSISGPIGIAQGAGASARSGLVQYLFFLALMSISLGVLNLLPIPLLDGGHLLYYAVEMIIRKPVPDRMKSIGVYVGMLLLGILMIIAFANDILRMFTI